uniref:Uncharacterized protein n=1 Tax=Arundo donax TaxID=35708 RepID=A0A0A8ZDD7_ARUDO
MFGNIQQKSSYLGGAQVSWNNALSVLTCIIISIKRSSSTLLHWGVVC